MPRFRVTSVLFVAALATGLVSASLSAAPTEAGKVLFAVGTAHAIDTSAKKRPLGTGAKIFSGDLLETGDGRLQILFRDGARVSLEPKSRFRVDEYEFSGNADGTERGFFSLLRGALRTITGAIGKANRDAYQLNAVVATIGIRGTGFRAQLCDANCRDGAGKLIDDGLYTNVSEGAIALKNGAGVLDVVSGNSAFVRDIQTLPELVPINLNDVIRASARPDSKSEEENKKAGSRVSGSSEWPAAADLRSTLKSPTGDGTLGPSSILRSTTRLGEPTGALKGSTLPSLEPKLGDTSVLTSPTLLEPVLSEPVLSPGVPGAVVQQPLLPAPTVQDPLLPGAVLPRLDAPDLQRLNK